MRVASINYEHYSNSTSDDPIQPKRTHGQYFQGIVDLERDVPLRGADILQTATFPRRVLTLAALEVSTAFASSTLSGPR